MPMQQLAKPRSSRSHAGSLLQLRASRGADRDDALQTQLLRMHQSVGNQAVMRMVMNISAKPSGNSGLQRKCGSACKCSSCNTGGGSEQEEVIQRAYEDDDEWLPGNDETDCEEDNCVDEDCYVKYGINIRDKFYPSGYSVATDNWKANRVQALGTNCAVGEFECPECDTCLDVSNATIDHETPVAQHWNDEGHDQSQVQRRDWYNDTDNMEVVCGSCNSSMGSGGVTYDRKVGPNFYGTADCY